MAMHIEPYLFLDGRCEEAVEFYRTALGAEVVRLARFRDAPESGMTPPGSEDKIMHAHLRIGGDTTLLMSDGRCQGTPRFEGFYLSIAAADDAEADRLFDALSAGGEVRMAMATTHFSSRFGMVADRFGVPWMVHSA